MKGVCMAHFLKPMGTKDNAVAEKEGAFDAKKITFAKDKKPKLREGNILILFAAGSQKLMTYLSAVSGVQFDPENEEYPWFVNTKDWAPEYSKRWWTFDNNLGTLASEHLALNPANMLGASKKLDASTFATAIYGKSNLEIHTDFAYLLINKIKAGGK
jgi:hypothetical protein